MLRQPTVVNRRGVFDVVGIYVGELIGYAERSFRDVPDLVPDFSVLTLGAGPGGTSRPRSC